MALHYSLGRAPSQVTSQYFFTHPITLHPITLYHSPPYHSPPHHSAPYHSSPYHSNLHPSTPPFNPSLHPIPRPFTPPLTPPFTLHPISRAITISLHPSPYQSTHREPCCRNTSRCRTQTEALRSNHCISPRKPTHSAMMDRHPACIALSKQVPWRAVADITLHHFATFPNTAHHVLTVLLWLHECCHACQQALFDKRQDHMQF